MIGGYLYNRLDANVEERLKVLLGETFQKTKVNNNGYIFHDNPFQDDRMTLKITDDRIVLSQDLLIINGSDGEYRIIGPEAEKHLFGKKDREDIFNAIVSDFRMVFVEKEPVIKICLVSNRAGAGRMFYHIMNHGILFSSDLRFLLDIIPFDVNRTGIYSIIKYGAIPEPLTISNNVSAVPAAHFLKYNLIQNQHSTHPYFKYEFTYGGNDNPLEIDHHILEPVKDSLLKSAKFLSKYQPSMLLSGGIDSSLYACYLNEAGAKNLNGFFCAFEDKDPEIKYAKEIARVVNANFLVGQMQKDDALGILEDVIQLTDHPFADFSSLPITFILKFIKKNLNESGLIIECNGADDCFGFPALGLESKYLSKHRFPAIFKQLIVQLFKGSAYWKFLSHEGLLARFAALSDVHEIDPLNYFLVHSPLNFIVNKVPREWDLKLAGIMENVFSACCIGYESLGYEAKTTVRQLMHINSRQWAAKALSVGESLGLRIIYPYIWRDILVEQGKLPWNAKIHNGVVKWPLKRLLEEFMPREFIYRQKSGFVPPFVSWLTDKDFNGLIRDIVLTGKSHVTEIVPARLLEELLNDALNNEKLRFSVLNFLWGAIFTEMWVQKYQIG